MKNFILLFLLLNVICSFGQINFNWTELWSKKTENAVFTVDNFQQLYYFDQNVLFKVDSTGKEIFKQSIKKWSEISNIDARNPMKLLCFSEDQQLVEYLDNTLTKQQDIIDLSAEDFSFVTKVASSSQPDKIWVFDSDNSRLTLYTQQKNQIQRIDNIYGLLNAKYIHQILEYNNQLFLVDPTKGIFVLDRYGTMIDFIQLPNIKHIQIENEKLYFLQDEKFFFMDLTDKYSEQIILPIDQVKRFHKIENKLYLFSKNELKLFSFENQN